MLLQGPKGSGFQSTCLREARPPWCSSSPGGAYFNPRAYVRHDQYPSGRIVLGLGFQSTCLREARQYYACHKCRHTSFQSTCLREARHPRNNVLHTAVYFNPRAYVRHDEPDLDTSNYVYEFQSTCLREARPAERLQQLRPRYFNPRAYVRHDIAPLRTDNRGPDFNPRAYVRHDQWRLV